MYIYKVNNVNVQGGKLSWKCDVCVSSQCAAVLIIQGLASARPCSFPRQLESHLKMNLVLEKELS